MPISTTRRDALRLSLLLTPVPSLFAASDFWNKKPVAEWSDDEIVQLKTKSPWAKKVTIEMAGGSRGGAAPGGGGGGEGGGGSMDGEGGGGRGGGRGGGGGGGGRGGGGGGMPSTQSLQLVVRWETAKPVVETSKLKLPPSFENHYAISVTGIPPQLLMAVLGGSGRGRGGRRGQGAEETTPQPPEDPAARQKAAVDRLLRSATLSAKSKDPENADIVVQTSDQKTMIFGFSSHTLPIAAGDKDVQFTLNLGMMNCKVKFDVREMSYQGELSL